MIYINLLPFREKKKVENVRRQVTIAVLCVIFAVAVMAYYSMSLINKVNDLTAKVENTRKELAETEKKAKEVDRIKARLKRLNQKIGAIKNIEKNRKASVRLLEDMTRIIVEKPKATKSGTLPDEYRKPVKRLWFTSFQSKGNNINIKGIALDNKTVADFMTRLESSKLYVNVTLKTLNQKKVNKLNLKSFVITCKKATLKKAKKKKAKTASGKAKT